MIVIKILGLTMELFLVFYIVLDIMVSIRNQKYQKLWRLKKSSLVTIDPAITHAELCEQYVLFCRRNGVKVDF